MGDNQKAEPPVDLAGARARHAAATRGPWRWFGNTKCKNVYLATTHSGRTYVMDFARWGMQSAQPTFRVCYGPGPRGETDLQWEPSRMVPLAELESCGAAHSPRWEVAPPGEPRYRDDFAGINNPNAALIEHCWADLRDAFARVDQIEGEVERCHAAMLGAAQEHAEGLAEVIRQLRLAEAENRALRSQAFEADGMPPYAEIEDAYDKGYGIRERAEDRASLRNGIEAAVDLATQRVRTRLGALTFDLEVFACKAGSAADLLRMLREAGHLPWP
jgi:hypothetical protein